MSAWDWDEPPMTETGQLLMPYERSDESSWLELVRLAATNAARVDRRSRWAYPYREGPQWDEP